MKKISYSDLWTLEAYAEARNGFRERVIRHKAKRRVHLGPHATLLFEDTLTMQYQIQEILRAEKIFDRREIQEEIDGYNQLIPDGSNFKATFLIEYEDPRDRARALACMPGVEHRAWLRIGEGEKSFAIADEDMDRTNEEKTSAVHFLRFELTREDVETLRREEADLKFGIDHTELSYSASVLPDTLDSLLNDLD